MVTETAPPAQKLTLGRLVHRLRNEKGLTQTRLSDLTGVSVSSLNRLQLANDPPLAAPLFRIAEVLDIDLQTLKVLVLQADAEKRAAEERGGGGAA